MLYVIAGTSLSGKTSTRLHITNSRGISGIDSDTLRTMMNDLRPDMSVGHTYDPFTNYKNMRLCIRAFMHARSFFQEDYIFEGDAIHLEEIKQGIRAGKMKAVILGYPNETLEHRLALLRRNAPLLHWSRTVSPQILEEKIQQCIQFSIYLQKEAAKLGLDFIDVSAANDVTDTNAAVVAHLFSASLSSITPTARSTNSSGSLSPSKITHEPSSAARLS